MNDKIKNEFPLLQDVVYLDHAAATLYAKSQLENYIQDLSSHIYGNPHSRSLSSQLTSDAIENVRERILHYFGTSNRTHSVIFTASCTAAIKLVAETFKWNKITDRISPRHDTSGKSKCLNSLFVYLENSHTSVVGMREVASKHGADFNCVTEEQVINSLSIFKEVPDNLMDGYLQNCLFAYPAQCNFSGRKFPQSWTNSVKSNEYSSFVEHCGRWLVLLDAASYVMTSKLDLSSCCADFVPISFYKMFGFPTGLGALIIRNESAAFLKKTFFGGGTVQAYLNDENFYVEKTKIHEWFEDGTLPFLDIISLRHGFNTLQGLAGGITKISQHTFALAKYVHHELASYRYSNGKPVAKLYHDNDFEDITIQGAIVNFNILRQNGDYVGYSEVDKLANIYSIQLRTGCFCNTGACQKYLGISSEKVKTNFEAGHSCGDEIDLIDGQPTGSVRISFGYMSNWKDAEKFLLFIKECFMCEKYVKKEHISRLTAAIGSHDKCLERQTNGEARKNESTCQNHVPNLGQKQMELMQSVESNFKEPVESRLEKSIDTRFEMPNAANSEQYIPNGDGSNYLCKMFLYPIKSCGAMEVTEWEIGVRGLLYDREWMIVSENGVALTQKRNAKLCLIRPNINLNQKTLILNVKDKVSFSLPLEIKGTSSTSYPQQAATRLYQTRVCMNRVEGIDCGEDVSDWLSDVLGERCKLIKKHEKYKRLTKHKGDAVEVSFANESQFLLLNKASLDYLLTCLHQRECIEGSKEQLHNCQIDLQNLIGRFRANFVISGDTAFEEDKWEKIFIGGLKFKVFGPCARCQMVCVDQDTGVRGAEPLKTISTLQGRKMSFGVYLASQENQQVHKLSISDLVKVVTV